MGIGGLDFGLVGKQLSHATWWLVVAGALLVQVTRLTNAISLTSASPEPTPLGAGVGAEAGDGICGIRRPRAGCAHRGRRRLPSAARNGSRTALAVEGLDGLAQFCLQAILLIGLLTFTSASLELDLGAAIPDKLTLLLVVVLAAVVAAGITLALREKWRRAIIGWIRRLATEALHAARGVHSPRRLGLLFGGKSRKPNCYSLFRYS